MSPRPDFMRPQGGLHRGASGSGRWSRWPARVPADLREAIFRVFARSRVAAACRDGLGRFPSVREGSGQVPGGTMMASSAFWARADSRRSLSPSAREARLCTRPWVRMAKRELSRTRCSRRNCWSGVQPIQRSRGTSLKAPAASQSGRARCLHAARHGAGPCRQCRETEGNGTPPSGGPRDDAHVRHGSGARSPRAGRYPDPVMGEPPSLPDTASKTKWSAKNHLNRRIINRPGPVADRPCPSLRPVVSGPRYIRPKNPALCRVARSIQQPLDPTPALPGRGPGSGE